MIIQKNQNYLLLHSRSCSTRKKNKNIRLCHIIKTTEFSLRGYPLKCLQEGGGGSTK